MRRSMSVGVTGRTECIDTVHAESQTLYDLTQLVVCLHSFKFQFMKTAYD